MKKATRNQHDAAASLISAFTVKGKAISVSTSEYSVEQVSSWARKHGYKSAHGTAQAMRGFAKRGLIEWDQSYRSGDAIILDLDGLKAVRDSYYGEGK